MDGMSVRGRDWDVREQRPAPARAERLPDSSVQALPPGLCTSACALCPLPGRAVSLLWRCYLECGSSPGGTGARALRAQVSAEDPGQGEAGLSCLSAVWYLAMPSFCRTLSKHCVKCPASLCPHLSLYIYICGDSARVDLNKRRQGAWC